MKPLRTTVLVTAVAIGIAVAIVSLDLVAAGVSATPARTTAMEPTAVTAPAATSATPARSSALAPRAAVNAGVTASPTFNKDIAPILYSHCATCHRPGEVAPFSLLSYQDAARHAKTIAKVTARRVMPPWKAEPDHGSFANERRLTDDEITRIGDWVRAGAPEGDARDKPVVPSFPAGWQAGTPDRVLALDTNYTVPAEGPDQYRCFVLPTNLDRDVYVSGTEFRPGNRRVVHHAILFLDTTGTGRRLDAASPEPGYTCFGGPGFPPSGMLGGWAPGAMPAPRIEGVAKTIPKGSDIIVQVHYHPSGKPEHDASTLGLTFSDPPTRGQSAIILNSRQIDIPAGESHYVVKASIVVPRDVELVGITPHAHYLCKDMKIDAELPDGTQVPLIWIKDWDFNWQGQYAYKTPMHLPKGTRVALQYTYDNSADNPHNPATPPVRVTWGEQTKNEMALAFLRVLLPTPVSVPAFERAMRVQYLKAFVSQGGSINELHRIAPASDTAPLKTLLALFDSNGDGTLDAAERAALLQWLERGEPDDGAPAYDFARLDDFFTRAAATVPRGLEVLIVQNGQQIYWKQFGGWTKNKQVPIASGTKWYSGAVIMSLVDDGVLSLDDRASKYLPYMTGEKAAITLRQLMSHTAGFPGEFPVANRCLGDASDTLDHCAQVLAQVPLRAPAGTAFIYSGADMQIAGRVAEVVTRKDWQTLFRDRIATPLGLSATDYEYKGPTRNPRISGGGRSTVSDYMRFLTMIQQRGMYDGKRVLSAHAVEVMLADQTGGVPIVESPFKRAARRDPSAANNRYGIGNWLEDPDAAGHSSLNSSLGAAGWSPLIDASRSLQVVVGSQALGMFQRHYPDMKRVLFSVIPPAPAPATATSPTRSPASATATVTAKSSSATNTASARNVAPAPKLLLVSASQDASTQAATGQAVSSQGTGSQDAGTASKQEKGSPQLGDQARERLQQIKERLGLTPEQIEQLRPVLQEEVQKLKAVREKYGDDVQSQNRRSRLKMGREVRGIQKDTDDKLRPILSSKQMDEMKKIRDEWRQQFRERAGQR